MEESIQARGVWKQIMIRDPEDKSWGGATKCRSRNRIRDYTASLALVISRHLWFRVLEFILYDRELGTAIVWTIFLKKKVTGARQKRHLHGQKNKSSGRGTFRGRDRQVSAGNRRNLVSLAYGDLAVVVFLSNYSKPVTFRDVTTGKQLDEFSVYWRKFNKKRKEI